MLSVDETSSLSFLERNRVDFNFSGNEFLDENGEKIIKELNYFYLPLNFLLNQNGLVIGKNLKPNELKSLVLK